MENGNYFCCPNMAQNSSCERQCSSSLCSSPSDYGCNFPSLAMVYGPVQDFSELYEVKEAFCHGTLFKKLNMPFDRSKVCTRGVGGRCGR